MNKETKNKETKVEKKETVKGSSISRSKKTTPKTTPIKKKKIEAIVEKEEVVTAVKESPSIEKESIVKEVIIEKKSGFNVVEVVLIMIITLLFGGLAGGIIGYTACKKGTATTPENGNMPSEFSEFLQVYDTIKNEYYDTIDNSQLIEAGIKGMMGYLGDPYSSYLDPEQTEDFNEKLNGEYVGIGAEVSKLADGRLLVSGLLENSAAGNSGVLVGDQIIKVDDQDIADKSLTDVSKLLKGAEGTTVSVTVKREQEEKTFSVVRRKTTINSVVSQILTKEEKKIGVITVDIFAANTFTQFEKEVLKIQNEVDGIVIDLRGNTGGHLNVAEQMASLFVPKGSIIYQLESKGVKQPIYSTRSTDMKLPVIVLMNQNSASASEVLAAALKESYGATIVGEKSYGKGTVQTTKELGSGATIKYTFQKWLTPLGNWVHEKGIQPDVEVSLNSSYYENPSVDTDNQLQTAIETLLKK